MARPKKDKAAEAAKAKAKAKRIKDEKAIADKLKTEKVPLKELMTDERIDRLEFVIAKMAHFKGVSKIICEAGLREWLPGQQDMTKWKREHEGKGGDLV